jgi:hypothetical protein
VDFVRDIQPILRTACFTCHGPDKHKGGLRLDRKASAFGTGVVVPGHSADSPLVRRVAGLGNEPRMPPRGAPLTPRQIALLRAWIDQGAGWPELAGPQGNGPTHWAYRPLCRPGIPTVRTPGWVRNPIDAFVLARLEAAGISPSPEADRRTLIRRLSFDIIGLPPTPSEIDAFLADESPLAYERVVERMLASSAYGERWARHWMDVVHYAETHGHDQDAPRENAWPYRDYLIRSFNADKPWARFVAEQVAGDVLWPDEPDGVIATGMLAAGPWDESSLKDIRDDTLDKEIAQVIDRDDMLTTTLSAFTSTTIHCARCHDHKFDPISQQEYYGLQAVFAGIDRADRPYDSDPQVARIRAALQKRLKELDGPLEAQFPMLLAPEAQAAVARWERGQGPAVRWAVLHPTAVRSRAGSLPMVEADGSVRFGGPRPDKDTYTIETVADLREITAVRLEVLTDDSLPHHGPGRQDNGNLHLSEFQLRAAPREQPQAQRPVGVHSASADFNQEGCGIEKAIDNNPQTAWGIYPEVGKPHEAVFELAQPVRLPAALLTFRLAQDHGGGRLIGRLRLSVTNSRRPVRASPAPPELRPVLAVPAENRTDLQRAELARWVLREKARRALAALPRPRMVYAAATDFAPREHFRPARGCRPVHVLRRGDVRMPGEAAVPGALSCVPGLASRFELNDSGDEGQRRAALARWLTHRDNVLTWRSAANRAWHYHFGRGIVATPGDLGRMGAAPTHPELLDWLAVYLRDQAGGSLKALHRLIVTSAAYRQSSAHRPDCAARDGDNLLLWRMNRTRLDAEQVHDAVLCASGHLEHTMGGPSVKNFVMGKGVHVTPTVDYLAYDPDGPGSGRRSVYRFVFRTLPDPFMDALDCPDASQFTPVRINSVTPLQALALLNDRFMLRQAEHLAARLRDAGDVRQQVDRAYLLALGRPPEPAEETRLADYARQHGMANACRLLFNCNEFLFVP